MKKRVKYGFLLLFVFCAIGSTTVFADTELESTTNTEKEITLDGNTTTYQSVEGSRYGFGNTTGFEFNLPGTEYEAEVTFSNPYEETYTVEVWDEFGKQTKKQKIEPGQTISVQFRVSVIQNNLKLFFLAETDAFATEQKEILIHSIRIKTVEQEISSQPTLHIVGDSIARSYSSNVYPRTGWGQTLVKYMEHGQVLYEKYEEAEHDLCDYTEYGMPSFTVKNWAHSGDSSESFWKLGKFDCILNEVKQGDYLLIQLGNNDIRKAPNYYSTPEKYSQNLERFIIGCKERGAQCILLSPTPKCIYSKGVIKTTAPSHKAKLKPLAKKTGAVFVDTGAAIEKYMTTVGEKQARTYYMIFKSGLYSHYPNGKNDNHHFNVTGATKIGQIIAVTLKENSKTPEFLRNVITADSNYYKGVTVTLQKKKIKAQVTKKKGSRTKKITRYRLSWTKQKNAKKYIIYRYDSKKKTYKKLKTTTKTTYLFDKKWKKSQVSKMKVVAVLGR